MFVRHGEHLPNFSFDFFDFFFPLLLPIISLTFLFCLNAVIDWQLNISFRDSFIAINEYLEQHNFKFKLV